MGLEPRLGNHNQVIFTFTDVIYKIGCLVAHRLGIHVTKRQKDPIHVVGRQTMHFSKVWDIPALPKSETSSPGLLGCPPFSGDYPVLLTFYSGYRKHLPNLFNTSRGLKFERAYLRREIFVSKSIGLAIQLEVNLPFLLCFTLYLGAIFQVQAPGGLIFGGAI